MAFASFEEDPVSSSCKLLEMYLKLFNERNQIYDYECT